jgi:hypothetical protein
MVVRITMFRVLAAVDTAMSIQEVKLVADGKDSRDE